MTMIIFRILFVSIMLGLMIITLRSCFKLGKELKESRKKNVFKKDSNYIINRNCRNNPDNICSPYPLTMYCPKREDKLLNRQAGLFV